MAALDTNVVVRLITGDDARQTAQATRLLEKESCSIAPSVLMECEWVLRAAYGMEAARIAQLFRQLLALKQVVAQSPALTERVLDAFEAGMDFADALHALQTPEGEAFATFDAALVKRAARAGVRGVALARTSSLNIC